MTLQKSVQSIKALKKKEEKKRFSVKIIKLKKKVLKYIVKLMTVIDLILAVASCKNVSE